MVLETTYIDAESVDELTRRALNLDGNLIQDRESFLYSIVNGAGVTVLCGPAALDFWGVASPAINITVVPDGYDYEKRITPALWAALRVYSKRDAVVAAKRTKPPTRGRLVGAYSAYQKLLDDFSKQVQLTTPLIATEKVLIHYDDFPALSNQTALDWEWARKDLSPLGLAASDTDDNHYIPVRAFDGNFHSGTSVREQFRTYLRAKVPSVFHNGRSDLSTQYPSDPIELFGHPIDDTLLMAFVLDPNSPALGLKQLTPRYLGRRAIPYPGNVEEIDVESAARYAAGSDTKNTLALYHVLKSKLIDANLWSVYANIERPLVPLVASMEQQGVEVDVKRVLNEYYNHVVIEESLRRAIDPRIKKAAGARDYLRKSLGFDPGTLDQREISKYTEPEIDLYLYYTRTRTRRRNFLAGILRQWKASGKLPHLLLHPRYNQAGYERDNGSAVRAPRTGRFSSSGPNFQQQPRSLRHIYVPPAGHKWFKWDYGQIELRLAANASRDPNLIADILSGDPHGRFQAEIASLSGRDPGRPTAKTAAFEKLYFGGDRQLVKVLQKGSVDTDRIFIDLALARKIGQAHANRYAGYYEWGAGVVSDTEHNKYTAYTANGRARYISELRSRDPEIRGHGVRAAINFTIQGWAADVMKMTMARLVPIMQKYGAHLAITVHDEIDGWIPIDADHESFKREVEEAMTDWNLGPVPLLVEGGIYDDWSTK